CRGEPTAGKIRERVKRQRNRLTAQKKGRQSKQSAQYRGQKLRFPFFSLMRVLEKFDIARHHLRPRNIPPAPEFWRRWARDARNRCDIPLPADRDFLSLGLGKRPFAGVTIPVADQQMTWVVCIRALGSFNPVADSLGDLRDVRPAERRHGDSLPS